MPRADRIKAGDRQLSARNINKVIEQANHLESAQGGSGVGVLNDETGIQIQNMRRRQRPDGDTPYSSSGPLRRTIKKRSDSTRHKTEWELYNSSTVSQQAHTTTSGLPQFYGVPFLPVSTSTDSSNNINEGSLLWGVMDADEFGTSGPRSLERRSSSSGERFQIYAFNDDALSLDSSEVVQVPVRRRFGSSGNHYIGWVNSSDLLSSSQSGLVFDASTPQDVAGAGSVGTSDKISRSDHVHRAPHWNEMQDANTSVYMHPNAEINAYNLHIGSSSKRWEDYFVRCDDDITMYAGYTENGLGGPRLRFLMAEFGTVGSNISLDAFDQASINLRAGGDVNLEAGDDIILTATGQVVIAGLPSSDPSYSGALFTQTATQLGGSGTTKVVCIS